MVQMTPEARSRIMSANTKPELSYYGIKQDRFRILAQRRWASQDLYDPPPHWAPNCFRDIWRE